MTDKNVTRVFIVDDHPIVRAGLAQLINREKDLEVCGEADDAISALDAIQNLKPDIAIVDISLKGINGLQLVKSITARYKDVAVLILSMHDERVYAERGLHAGAKGYIMKQEATKKVTSAIRQIMEGQIYLSDDLTKLMMKKIASSGDKTTISSLESLTNRELEVYQLIGQGYKTQQISEKLMLSVKTIETYREHIKNKLDLANSAELIRHAIAWVHDEKLE